MLPKDDPVVVSIKAYLATAHHEAGHAVVSHALGVAVDRVAADDSGGVARFDARKARGLLACDSEQIGRLVALTLAGYFAERRYLASAGGAPAVLARRSYSLDGACGDLAAIERRNPHSTVNELGYWHEMARHTWRTPDDWRSFTHAWARVSGRLVRQLWPHVETLASELVASDGEVKGRALKRLLKPVPLWLERVTWSPSWFAELMAQAS